MSTSGFSIPGEEISNLNASSSSPKLSSSLEMVLLSFAQKSILTPALPSIKNLMTVSVELLSVSTKKQSVSTSWFSIMFFMALTLLINKWS